MAEIKLLLIILGLYAAAISFIALVLFPELIQ